MAENVPKTARALFQPDFEKDDITLLTDSPVPVPKPGSDEHLIRVHAVAPSAGELTWFRWFKVPDPSAKVFIPGYDISGVVVTTPGGSPFKIGEAVYGRTNPQRTGSARDYTIALTSELARKPESLSWTEAASIPMSAQTAWQGLFDQAGLPASKGASKGKRVLVPAAAGGVGIWLVQLAKWAGAEVIGTCSPQNAELVKSLGADEVIDYRSTSLKNWVAADPAARKVDVVVDGVGGKSLEDSWWTVKDGGSIIGIKSPPADSKPSGFTGADIKDIFFIVQANGQLQERISKLILAGEAKPFLDSVWPLEDYEAAFNVVNGGHARGKVVFDLFKPVGKA